MQTPPLFPQKWSSWSKKIFAYAPNILRRKKYVKEKKNVGKVLEIFSKIVKKKISTFFFSSDFKKKKFTYDSDDFKKKIALTQLRTFLKSSETYPIFYFNSDKI